MQECERICRLSQISGLPIIAVDTGKRLGSVRDVIFDPSAELVKGVSTESRGTLRSSRRYLLISDVKCLGEDAIMVRSEDVLKLPAEAPEEDDIVDDGVSLLGKSVITDCGTELGTISDVIINPDTGRALRYEVSGGALHDVQAGRRTFPVPGAMTVGPDALIVPGAIEQELEAQPSGGLQATYAGTRAGAQDTWTSIREWWDRTTHRASRATADQEAQFAMGKVAGQDITDDSGNVIVSQGDIVTPDVVARARRSRKLHELAASAGRGATTQGYETARRQITGAAREREEQFVLAKRVDRTITDDSGDVIIEEGSMVTQPVVDRAIRDGKLHELATSVASFQAKSVASQVGQRTKELAGTGRESVESATGQVKERRLTAEQREMAKGQVAAVDIVDAQGNAVIREGEIFTPMILDHLETEGLLDQIHLKPVMGSERRASEEAVPRIELRVCTEDAHHRGDDTE